MSQVSAQTSRTVLGVDPGLTRCGIGVVKGSAGAQLELVDVGVIQTSAQLPLEQRLLELEAALIDWLDKHRPDVIAVERVFSQHNVRTVMGTGQAAGIALLLAAKRGIPVVMHTPSEVKAHESDLTDDMKVYGDYKSYFSFAEKKGYSGVGIYTKVLPGTLL